MFSEALEKTSVRHTIGNENGSFYFEDKNIASKRPTKDHVGFLPTDPKTS